MGVLQELREGLALHQGGTAGTGRGAAGSSGVAVHHPSSARILVSLLDNGARPSERPGPCSRGRPEWNRVEAQVPQGFIVPVGEMGRQPRAPPDGSPAAKYRLSTPVFASSAPSASVAKFLCSRRRSKR